MKRVFIIVLDSCGIGEMPDASDFGDRDCNTLKRISKSSRFSAENLKAMGICNIDGVDYLGYNPSPNAAVARMTERSAGKDTTVGHWEIAGIISGAPLPVYPNGFPDRILSEFSKKTGRGVICNKPYSGTQVIKDYGREHIRTGNFIVYTSADSVFQIAAHQDIVSIDELYEACRIARKILCGEHSVGRVIARPFTGEYPDFKRTASRRDFSLEPAGNTLLDALFAAGREVIAVGKISDIFAGRGITERIVTHSNMEGMSKTLELAERSFNGLCFVNLVDFDMLYGHRQDIDGYAGALSEFDTWLPSFTAKLKEDDMLIITADHGCDPGDLSTDHTREYTPLIVYGKKISPVNLKTRSSFADISAAAAEFLNVDFKGAGESFLKDILK